MESGCGAYPVAGLAGLCHTESRILSLLASKGIRNDYQTNIINRLTLVE